MNGIRAGVLGIAVLVRIIVFQVSLNEDGSRTCVVTFHLVEVLLCMASNLSASPGADVALDLFPILPVDLQS